MASSNFTCPHCLYEAPLYLFENISSGMLKCRRCRSKFEDPNAFGTDVTYADCDSRRAVTRFPFTLNGKHAVIHVREGYLALALGFDGQLLWLHAGDHVINDMPHGFQLYYVCLTPQILWGTKDLEDFGAYGIAHLTLGREYVQSWCGMDGRIQTFEEHLRTLVSGHVTGYVRRMAEKHSTALLKRSDGYTSVLGNVEEGVSLTKIEPRGYRSGDGFTEAFPSHTAQPLFTEPEEVILARRSPVDMVIPPRKTYPIKDGVEEVFLRATGKAERHKAGEVIEAESLANVNKLLRFNAREFDFAHGWGLYDQACSALACSFSAHGTISFYIDSTEKLSALLATTASFGEFEEHFFVNVLRKEVATALKEIIDEHVRRMGLDPARINEHLSAMSVELTNALNGEGANAKRPAFSQYGLRVNTADILNINFYSGRR